MIKVTIWNEYEEERQYDHVAKVYPKGIHGCIEEFLSKNEDIQVRCVTLDMPDQGLSEEVLSDTDVPILKYASYAFFKLINIPSLINIF